MIHQCYISNTIDGRQVSNASTVILRALDAYRALPNYGEAELVSIMVERQYECDYDTLEDRVSYEACVTYELKELSDV